MNKTAVNTHAYVAFGLGTVASAAVENRSNLKATARVVAEFIRRGWQVERMTIGKANRLIKRARGTPIESRRRKL
jgi:hypothetical protein